MLLNAIIINDLNVCKSIRENVIKSNSYYVKIREAYLLNRIYHIPGLVSDQPLNESLCKILVINLIIFV